MDVGVFVFIFFDVMIRTHVKPMHNIRLIIVGMVIDVDDVSMSKTSFVGYTNKTWSRGLAMVMKYSVSMKAINVYKAIAVYAIAFAAFLENECMSTYGKEWLLPLSQTRFHRISAQT